MIRALNENDLDAFIDLRLEGLKAYPQSFGASYEEGLDREQTFRDLQQKNDENFILGYFQADQLVAMLGFVREKRWKRKHKGFIWGMYVSTSVQGQGIGKRLLQAAIERVRQIDDMKAIILTFTASHESVKSLYLGLGFEIYGVEKAALRLGDEFFDEVYMRLAL